VVRKSLASARAGVFVGLELRPDLRPKVVGRKDLLPARPGPSQRKKSLRTRPLPLRPRRRSVPDRNEAAVET